MKRSIIIYTIIATLLSSSCKDSFFDETPTDQLNTGNFFSSRSNIETVLNDAYLRLRGVYDHQNTFGDLASDDTYNSKLNNDFDRIAFNESTVDANAGVLQSMWSNSYQVIARTNLVLYNIQNISMDQDIKNRLKGEALFLRSLIYFNLIRIFGDVPLVLTPVNSVDEAYGYSRTPIGEIYSQISIDLKLAEDWLPGTYTTNNDIGRATTNAVKSLQGDIFLTYEKDYSKAAAKFLEIINAPDHELLSDYSEVFAAENANNKEIIFAVQYARGFDPAQGNPFAYWAWPNEKVGTGVITLGQGNILMTDDLDAAFEDGDNRKLMNNYDFETGYSRRYVFTRKYYDTGMETIDPGNDWIIYRFADILLKYAEAVNEDGDQEKAFTYLNMIRTRAGLTTPVGMNQSAMRDAIAHERRVELNNEGHRWFDLLRTGKLKEVMDAHFKDASLDDDQNGSGSSTIEDHEYVFPLPIFEVDLSPKLIQNPGY